jgi:hypothetical protein
VAGRGRDDLRDTPELWDLDSCDGDGRCRELRHGGGSLTRLARLARSGHDLAVAARSDRTPRVRNPARPGREPLTIPLPGAAGDLSTASPDLVYVLVDEHRFAPRLTGLGTVLPG